MERIDMRKHLNNAKNFKDSNNFKNFQVYGQTGELCA